jgi:hypothetical protein
MRGILLFFLFLASAAPSLAVESTTPLPMLLKICTSILGQTGRLFRVRPEPPVDILAKFNAVDAENTQWTTNFRAKSTSLAKRKAAIKADTALSEDQRQQLLAKVQSELKALMELQLAKTVEFEARKDELLGRLQRAEEYYGYRIDRSAHDELRRKENDGYVASDFDERAANRR